MDEFEMSELIQEALELKNEEDIENEEEATFESINNFEDALVLSRNVGFIITNKKGEEFQITIIKSK